MYCVVTAGPIRIKSGLFITCEDPPSVRFIYSLKQNCRSAPSDLGFVTMITIISISISIIIISLMITGFKECWKCKTKGASDWVENLHSETTIGAPCVVVWALSQTVLLSLLLQKKTIRIIRQCLKTCQASGSTKNSKSPNTLIQTQ